VAGASTGLPVAVRDGPRTRRVGMMEWILRFDFDVSRVFRPSRIESRDAPAGWHSEDKFQACVATDLDGVRSVYSDKSLRDPRLSNRQARAADVGAAGLGIVCSPASIDAFLQSWRILSRVKEPFQHTSYICTQELLRRRRGWGSRSPPYTVEQARSAWPSSRGKRGSHD
jgi:hypothetical protein